MSLLNSTQELLKLAEQLSGRPVRVREDQTLGVLATVKMARGNAPMHMISYRPIPGQRPDYHICYQCGFIIRLFETPPDGRFDFGPDPSASIHMDAILADPSLPPETAQAKDLLLNGLLTNLRLSPTGLRIEAGLGSGSATLKRSRLPPPSFSLSRTS